MSRAGYAALATLLEGVGRLGPGLVEQYNSGIRSKNRDSILRWSADEARAWAEEQDKIRKLEREAERVGTPLPTDPALRRAAIGANGLDPAADGSFEEFVAADRKNPEKVARLQAQANATGMGIAVDGVYGKDSARAEQRLSAMRLPDEKDPYFQEAIRMGADPETARALKAQTLAKVDSAGKTGGVVESAVAGRSAVGPGYVKTSSGNSSTVKSDPISDALQGRAIQFGNDLLSRKEQGFAGDDAEEAKLQHEYDLLRGYSSQLDEKDLPALLKRIEAVQARRKDHIAADGSVRGDQTQAFTGLLSSMSATQRAAEAATARADDREKDRELKDRLERMKEGGRNARHGANLAFRRDQAFNDFVKYDAGNSLKALLGAQRNAGMIASAIKGKRPEQVASILKGFGIHAELQKPFFGRATVEWDESSVRDAIAEASAAYQDAAVRLRNQSRRQVGEGPSGAGGGGGTSGKRSLSEY